MGNSKAKGVDHWITSDSELIAVCQDKSTTALSVRGTKIKDFTPILQLEGLRSLKIFDFARGDFQLLSRLSSLRLLLVQHIPQVQELDALSELELLEDLCLASLPSWDASGKTLRFKTLAPLQNCRRLRRLTFMKAAVETGGLKPLHGLNKLNEFVTDNTFSMEDFAAMAGALPNCSGDYLIPYSEAKWHSPCRSCGKKKVRLSGVRRGGVQCCTCNAKRVEAHVAEFERIAGRKFDRDFIATTD